jgi:hypothetical protein
MSHSLPHTICQVCTGVCTARAFRGSSARLTHDFKPNPPSQAALEGPYGIRTSLQIACFWCPRYHRGMHAAAVSDPKRRRLSSFHLPDNRPSAHVLAFHAVSLVTGHHQRSGSRALDIAPRGWEHRRSQGGVNLSSCGVPSLGGSRRLLFRPQVPCVKRSLACVPRPCSHTPNRREEPNA